MFCCNSNTHMGFLCYNHHGTYTHIVFLLFITFYSILFAMVSSLHYQVPVDSPTGGFPSSKALACYHFRLVGIRVLHDGAETRFLSDVLITNINQPTVVCVIVFLPLKIVSPFSFLLNYYSLADFCGRFQKNCPSDYNESSCMPLKTFLFKDRYKRYT